MTKSIQLSDLLRRPIVDERGDEVGKVADVVVRLRGEAYPLAIGFVLSVGRRQVFLPSSRVGELSDLPLRLRRPKVDLRRFERREGEVLLRADVLRHRLIDVADARLVHASDVDLTREAGEWTVTAIDTQARRRFFGLFGSEPRHNPEDWKAFEPLIGHAASALSRGAFGRVKGLKPAQIANLLEVASSEEGSEILEVVHADPELEADVFEELEAQEQGRLFAARSDEEVADVLSRMRADDAADAVAELPQGRRQSVLDLLPAGQRTKVLTLLGFNPASAGGLMGVDFLAMPAELTVGRALLAVRSSAHFQLEALVTIYTTDESGRLAGVAWLPALLSASPAARLDEIAEPDPVHVHPETDVVDLALLMSDYNLVTVPVADEDHRVLGIVTVDDILEATIPEEWRRRERSHHPETNTAEQPPSPDDAEALSPNSPVT